MATANQQQAPSLETLAPVRVEGGDRPITKNELVTVLAWLIPEVSAQEVSNAIDRAK